MDTTRRRGAVSGRAAARSSGNSCAAAGPVPLLRVAAFALAGLALRQLRKPPAAPRPEPALALPPPAEEADATADDAHGTCCRFCFGGAAEGDLISPCACRGTQAHVHTRCLREWQRSSLVLRGAREDVCRVCGVRFAAPRPPLRAIVAQWFAPRAADRLAVWSVAWVQLLANTLLPLNEKRLAGWADCVLLFVAAEGRVLMWREMVRGRPALRALRAAAIACDGMHAAAVLCWLAAVGAAGAGDALRAAAAAGVQRGGIGRAAAAVAAPVSHVLCAAAAGLLLPVRGLVRAGEPLHRVVTLLERWPQFRL